MNTISPSYIFVAIAAVLMGYAILQAGQENLSLVTITLQLVAIGCLQMAQYSKGQE